MMLLEEADPRGWNWDSWVMIGVGTEESPDFGDPIAYWHDNGCVIAFADTHAEHYVFKERDTLRWLSYVEEQARNGNQSILRYSITPGGVKDAGLNEDWLYFARIYSF